MCCAWKLNQFSKFEFNSKYTWTVLGHTTHWESLLEKHRTNRGRCWLCSEEKENLNICPDYHYVCTVSRFSQILLRLATLFDTLAQSNKSRFKSYRKKSAFYVKITTLSFDWPRHVNRTIVVCNGVEPDCLTAVSNPLPHFQSTIFPTVIPPLQMAIIDILLHKQKQQKSAPAICSDLWYSSVCG